MKFQVVEPAGLDLSPFQILEVSSRWSRGPAALPGAIRIDPCFVEAAQETDRYFPRYRDSGDALLHPHLESILEGLGLERKQPLLISGTGPWGPVNAGRVAWALCATGFCDVYWLNGGSRTWTPGHHPWEPSGVEVPPNCLARADQFQDALLVDVRSRAEYQGSRQDRYRFFRSHGHLPKALWLGDWTSLVRPDRRLRERSQLQTRWRNLGLDPDRDLVFYCGTGWRSSLACCVALWLGYSKVRNYDGGIYDWVSRGGETVTGCGRPER